MHGTAAAAASLVGWQLTDDTAAAAVPCNRSVHQIECCTHMATVNRIILSSTLTKGHHSPEVVQPLPVLVESPEDALNHGLQQDTRQGRISICSLVCDCEITCGRGPMWVGVLAADMSLLNGGSLILKCCASFTSCLNGIMSMLHIYRACHHHLPRVLPVCSPGSQHQ